MINKHKQFKFIIGDILYFYDTLTNNFPMKCYNLFKISERTILKILPKSFYIKAEIKIDHRNKVKNIASYTKIMCSL